LTHCLIKLTVNRNVYLLDFTVDYISQNLSIPNIAEPTPSIFIGGWLIIQKNVPDQDSIFNGSWFEYRNGFGDPAGKYFWLGNEKLYQLMTTGNWKLRVEVKSNDTGAWYSAEYESFRLSNEAGNYTLNVSGYIGDAGDAYEVVEQAVWKVNGMQFSTFDSDNDKDSTGNCALNQGGGWYQKCGTSSLNAFLGTGNSWGTLKILGLSPKRFVASSRMMIRRN